MLLYEVDRLDAHLSLIGCILDVSFIAYSVRLVHIYGTRELTRDGRDGRESSLVEFTYLSYLGC